MLAIIQILRPGNVLITGLSVYVGGVVSGASWYAVPGNLWLAAIAAALIAGGGNAFNDYCDRDLDRIQKAHRPIPSGQISPSTALILTGFAFTCGFALSIFIDAAAILIALCAIVALLLYSWRWKSQPLVGNLAVAFIAALAFIFGGNAVGSLHPAIWAALMAFFFHLSREISKDLEDYEGDAESGVQTLVVKHGQVAGKIAALLAFTGLIVLLPLPHFIGGFSRIYLMIVLAGVLPIILISMIALWKWSDAQRLHRINLLLKADMILGLIALLMGKPQL